MKRIKLYLVAVFLFATLTMTAQLKVGNNPTTINSSAVLEAESTNKGFLPPRIALTSTNDATTISSPATGLLIYNTATAGAYPNGVTPGYYFFNGTSWAPITSPSAPGQVIKMTMLPPASIGQASVTQISSTSPTYTTIASYSYTPASSSSYIIVEYNTIYWVGGNGFDTWNSRIMLNGTEVSSGYQFWESSPGGGGRSGTIFPLMGRYTNSATSAVTIDVQATRNGSDDIVNFYATNGTWLKITEIAR